MSAPARSGVVAFGDAALYVREEPDRPAYLGGDWERDFKKDVLLRILQQLNRMGWSCEIPAEMIRRYSLSFARKFRHCQRGDLRAELSVSGRCIKLEMWQDLHNVSNPNGGRYDFGKEQRMPYLMRLRMEYTRRTIRDYLLNIFQGYAWEPSKAPRGPNGLTAREWIEQRTAGCWHYQASRGRRGGEELCGNNRSAEGDALKHGARVWTTDSKGRLIEGEAFYNINNMWWVITGRYDCTNVASSQIYANRPAELRKKRNARAAATRIQSELDRAVKTENFERAIVLRSVKAQRAEVANG